MKPIKIDTSKLPDTARIFIIEENEYTRHLILDAPLSSFSHINTLVKYYDNNLEFKKTVIVKVTDDNHLTYETTTKKSIKPILLKEKH